MTPASRRLAAMVAVFAPGRAGALLARIDGEEAAAALALAGALAGAPRRERLRALAAALAADPPSVAARGRAAAAAERPRVAALLRAAAADGAGATAGTTAIAPALARLCREAIGR